MSTEILVDLVTEVMLSDLRKQYKKQGEGQRFVLSETHLKSYVI